MRVDYKNFMLVEQGLMFVMSRFGLINLHADSLNKHVSNFRFWLKIIENRRKRST